MSNSLIIDGGVPLRGEVEIQGSKNAALPILMASILCNSPMKLCNVSTKLLDIQNTLALLKSFSIKVTKGSQGSNQWVILNGKNMRNSVSCPNLAGQLRASILLLGPLLARFGQAKVPLPGGCSIGLRPIDLHIQGLEQMGVQIKLENDFIIAQGPPQGLAGTRIIFSVDSVGATENLVMAATLARGKTTLVNVAKDPEVVDLVRCLRVMGACIKGEGTNVIEVYGIQAGQLLKGGKLYRVMSDRIEAGSYAIAALATRGEIILKNLNWEATVSQDNFWEYLRAVGGGVEYLEGNSIRIYYKQKIRCIPTQAKSYPGFPTDLQSPWVVLMSLAKGECLVEDHVFENRFQCVPHLKKMGANIRHIDGSTICVRGVSSFRSTEEVLSCTDLRAGFALILAGLCANGRTVVDNVHHVDRGYGDLVDKFCLMGGSIKPGRV